MRSFLALVRCQTIILRRSPGYWISSLILAVLSIVVFGYLFTGSLRDLPLGVADEDQSEASRQVVQSLGDVEGIDLKAGNEREELAALKDGDRWAVMVLPPGFGQSLSAGRAEVSVYYNNTNLAAATASRSTLQTIITGLNRSLTDSPEPVVLREEGVEAKRLRMIDFVLPGMVGLTMLFSNMTAAGWLVMWRSTGALKRLRVTPVSASTIILAQMASFLILSVVQVAVILFLGRVLFDISVAGSYGVLVVVVFVGGVTLLGLGYLVASPFRSIITASAAVNLVSLPMMFLGGSYFPTESAPAFMSPVIHALPLFYLNEAVRGVMNDGDGLRAVAVNLGILGGWAAACFAAAARLFRWE